MQLELRQLVKLNEIISRHDDIFVGADDQQDYVSLCAKLAKALNVKVNMNLTRAELLVAQNVLEVEDEYEDVDELYKVVCSAIRA